MGFIITHLLMLSIAATIIPAWFLTVRFGLFASVLGTLALAGGSFVLRGTRKCIGSRQI